MIARTRVPFLAALVWLAVAGGCASSGSGSQSQGDPNRISATELEENGTMDLLTLIQRVRPRWLQARGSMGFGGAMPPALFLDGIRDMGGLGTLRSVRVLEVESVEYMNAADATTRYGTDMAGGAILVVRKR